MAQLVKVLTAFGVYHGGRESTPVSCALTSVGTLWPCSLCTGTVRNPVADVAAQNGYSSPSSLGASPPFPVINLSPRRQTGTATLGCKAGCPQRRNRSQSDTELSSDHPFPRGAWNLGTCSSHRANPLGFLSPQTHGTHPICKVVISTRQCSAELNCSLLSVVTCPATRTSKVSVLCSKNK
jgi:hypothetical protein